MGETRSLPFVTTTLANNSGNNLLDIIRLLLEAKIDVNSKNKFSWNCLIALVEKQHNHRDLVYILKLLIASKIDVNVKDENGMNSLIYLCEKYNGNNFPETVRILIKGGIFVNAVNSQGWSALFSLCYVYKAADLIHVTRHLLDAGIDVNKESEDHWTSLLTLADTQANHHDFFEILKLFIDQKVNVNATVPDTGRNVLMILCADFKYQGERLAEIIRLLSLSGIQINAVDADGKNILHFVCKSYRLDDLEEIVSVLCKLAPDVCNAKNQQNKLPVDYLRPRKHLRNKDRIMKLLG